MCGAMPKTGRPEGLREKTLVRFVTNGVAFESGQTIIAHNTKRKKRTRLLLTDCTVHLFVNPGPHANKRLELYDKRATLVDQQCWPRLVQ